MLLDGLLPSGFRGLFSQNIHFSHLINLNMDFCEEESHTYALKKDITKRVHIFSLNRLTFSLQN